MPADAVRPMASARLGNVITLAHRLGMTWVDIQSSQGSFRAEGNGHSLISSTVRGLGVVFHYNFNYDMEESSRGFKPPTRGLSKRICLSLSARPRTIQIDS